MACNPNTKRTIVDILLSLLTSLALYFQNRQKTVGEDGLTRSERRRQNRAAKKAASAAEENEAEEVTETETEDDPPEADEPQGLPNPLF